jgi:fumarate reductase flavoprotein subunit
LLLDVDEYRFMPDYEPEKKELASRDVVSRRMTEHIRKGKGVPSPYGPHLWLDIRLLGKAHIEKNLREVQEICEYFLGIDPVKDLIPVRPTQHYSMGGVKTSPQGESPTLKGLFSVGEAACWDMHGFNRLGGNSVAETVVAGMIVGEYVADHCEAHDVDIDMATVRSFLNREQASIDAVMERGDGENPYELKAAMQKIMMDKVGIFRSAQPLAEAVEELRVLLERSRNIGCRAKARSANPELEQSLRVPRMIKLALCVAKGARDRTESRGAHAREDFTDRNDRDWLSRTLATWAKEDDLEPTLAYEPLDIMAMEMPPGSRGYGNAQAIEHPDTAKRVEEIEKIKASMPDADRHEIQKALMPYDLPEKYSGKNERSGIGTA